jgi:Spy/CpxP family protein refolding chaperone
MTKAKITFYIVLIFLAGAVAGGAVARKVWPAREHRPGPHRPPEPEKFEDHLFGIMKERLKLTPEQIQNIEPIFHAGFKEVRTIQDKTLAQVEDAVQRNHAEIAKQLTPDQKTELEKMDQERREFFKNHPGRHGGPPPHRPGEPFHPRPK